MTAPTSTSATPSTSFISSPTPATSVHAFTTPFPQPESCTSILTTKVEVYSDGGPTTSLTFLLPDESSPDYTKCVNPDPANHFSFSPAVCPEGWVGWWMGRTVAATVSGYISTAYCCAPGYSMYRQNEGDDPSPSCAREFVTTTSRSNERITRTEVLSVAQMPAWHISWYTTDLPTLTPQPPDLDSGYRVSKWVPGSDPQFQPVDNWGVGLSRSLFYFLVAGLPVVILVGIAACAYCCCFRRRYPVPMPTLGRSKAGQRTGDNGTVGAN